MDGRGGLPRFAEDPFFHHRNDDFLRDFPTAPSHRRFGSSPRLLDEEDGFFQSPFDDPTFHSLPRRGVPLRTSQRAQPQPQQQQNGRSPSQTDINKAGVERPIHVQRQQTVPPQQQQQQQQQKSAQQQQPPRSPVAKDAQHVTNVPVITVTEPPILEINNANPSSYTNGQLNPDKREQANGHVEHKENGQEQTNVDRVEDMPSAPQVNGTQGGGENGGYTRGKFTTDGCSEQLIHLLDEAERRVEQLRETANQMEQEKEQLLDLIGSVKLNAEILRIRPGERDDINATAERILKRCRTVDVVVNTPRNEEQSRALEDVNSLIQGVITKMQNDLASSKDTVRRFLNACSPDEPDGPIDQRFQAKVVECTADDQKKIRRKLAQLITQIDRAERACAPIV